MAQPDGLIQAQPVHGPRTAIVTGDHEALVSELFHDFDEIAPHLAEAEVDVVGTRFGQ